MPLTIEFAAIMALAMISGAYLERAWRCQVECRAAMSRLASANQRHRAWAARGRLLARAKFCKSHDRVWPPLPSRRVLAV